MVAQFVMVKIQFFLFDFQKDDSKYCTEKCTGTFDDVSIHFKTSAPGIRHVYIKSTNSYKQIKNAQKVKSLHVSFYTKIISFDEKSSGKYL